MVYQFNALVSVLLHDLLEGLDVGLGGRRQHLLVRIVGASVNAASCSITEAQSEDFLPAPVWQTSMEGGEVERSGDLVLASVGLLPLTGAGLGRAAVAQPVHLLNVRLGDGVEFLHIEYHINRCA